MINYKMFAYYSDTIQIVYTLMFYNIIIQYLLFKRLHMSQKDLNKSEQNLQIQNMKNNNQALPQSLQNIRNNPSFNSLNYQMSQKNESQKEDNNNQQLQRVNICQNVINQDQILKTYYAAQAQKEQKQKKQLELKKKMSKQKKLKEKQKQREKALSFQLESLTSHKQIKNPQQSQIDFNKKINTESIPFLESIIAEFKVQYHFSYFDNDLTKYRYQCKFALFLQLVVGVFQLSRLTNAQLQISEKQLLDSLQEQNIKNLHSKFNIGIFRHCRKITYEIDHNLFAYYQKKNSIINKQYKLQWSYLLNNIKDPQNFELRRKILTKEFSAQQITKAQQIQFFTAQKKIEIRQKQAKFLAQFTAEDKKLPQQQNQQILQRGRFQSFDFKAQMRQKNVISNKYVDQPTLTLLQDLVSSDHLTKMKNRIYQDLREPILTKIIANFNKEFRKQC